MKLINYKRMHQLMEASIGIGMLGMLALSFVPKHAKAEVPDTPAEVLYSIEYCQTQYPYNVSRHAKKSLHDCAYAISANIQKYQSLPKTAVRLGWEVRANEQCRTEMDVYQKQYCLMLVQAVVNYK